MPFDSYTTLSAAIGTWEDRTFATARTDEFIALVEAKANRRLRQDFRRRTSASIVTNASGVATLPAGFVGISSLVRDVLGSTPLKQVSWDALILRNPYEITSEAGVYAINDTALMVAPVTADTFVAKFSAILPGLSGTNATNWLLALAPDYYLFGGQAAASAYSKEYPAATALQAQADDILDELVSQGNVAEYASAEMTLPMATP